MGPKHFRGIRETGPRAENNDFANVFGILTTVVKIRKDKNKQTIWDLQLSDMVATWKWKEKDEKDRIGEYSNCINSIQITL